MNYQIYQLFLFYLTLIKLTFYNQTIIKIIFDNKIWRNFKKIFIRIEFTIIISILNSILINIVNSILINIY